MMACYWKMLLAKETVHIDTGRCLPEGSFDIYHSPENVLEACDQIKIKFMKITQLKNKTYNL